MCNWVHLRLWKITTLYATHFMAGLDIFDVNIFSQQGLVCLMRGPGVGLGYYLNKIFQEFILKIFLRNRNRWPEITTKKYCIKIYLSRIVLRYETKYLQRMKGLVQNFMSSRHIIPYTIKAYIQENGRKMPRLLIQPHISLNHNQAWNLSKILHSQIFRLHILYFSLTPRKCVICDIFLAN